MVKPTMTGKQRENGQSEKFRDAARKIGCDEDEAAFDAVLKKIGNAQAAKKPKAPLPKPIEKKKKQS